MAVKLRLARTGSKKRPHYRIVAADARAPRDGRYIEQIGTYHPLLPKDHQDRIRLDMEKAKQWIEKGAQPTDRVARFLEAGGILPATNRANLKKTRPGKKAEARVQAKLEASTKPKDEPAPAVAAAEAPAPEAAAEKTPAVEEAAAEKTPAEEPDTEKTAG